MRLPNFFGWSGADLLWNERPLLRCGRWKLDSFSSRLFEPLERRKEPAARLHAHGAAERGRWLRPRKISSIEAAGIGAGRRLPITKTPGDGKLRSFASELWHKFLDDNVNDGAAILAFFFVLAAFPATIFVLSLLPAISLPHLQQAILDLLHQVLPAQSADFFDGAVGYAAAEGKKGLITMGLVLALWSGSSGVYAGMEQLNVVHEVRDQRPFWRARGTAVLLMLFFSALALASLSLVIFGGVVQSWVAGMIGWSQPLRIFFAALRWVILAAALLFALAIGYRFGPAADVRFRFLSAGNVFAASVVAVGSAAFRLYVAKFGNYNAEYGNLAAAIILMLWMYLAGTALLVGCEIDTLLARRADGAKRS